MNMIFVLIILAVILLCAAIVVFFWAVRSRQFDDLDVHAYNILKEDDYYEHEQISSSSSKVSGNSSDLSSGDFSENKE